MFFVKQFSPMTYLKSSHFTPFLQKEYSENLLFYTTIYQFTLFHLLTLFLYFVTLKSQKSINYTCKARRSYDENTGVIRKLDELGRITLPIELRRSLDLDVKDGLEITVQDDCIILKKAESADIFTGSTEDLLEYEGKKVSRSSILALAKLAGLNVSEA